MNGMKNSDTGRLKYSFYLKINFLKQNYTNFDMFFFKTLIFLFFTNNCMSTIICSIQTVFVVTFVNYGTPIITYVDMVTFQNIVVSY